MKIENPQNTIFYSIERTIKQYKRFAQGKITKVFPDLTIDQSLLLLFLNEHSDLPQTELAQILFKDNASITRMIDLLVKKDLLDRKTDAADRRRYTLITSQRGSKVLGGLIAIVQENRDRALNGVTEEELEQLRSTLNKIYKNCTA